MGSHDRQCAELFRALQEDETVPMTPGITCIAKYRQASIILDAIQPVPQFRKNRKLFGSVALNERLRAFASDAGYIFAFMQTET